MENYTTTATKNYGHPTRQPPFLVQFVKRTPSQTIYLELITLLTAIFPFKLHTEVVSYLTREK